MFESEVLRAPRIFLRAAVVSEGFRLELWAPGRLCQKVSRIRGGLSVSQAACCRIFRLNVQNIPVRGTLGAFATPNGTV